MAPEQFRERARAPAERLAYQLGVRRGWSVSPHIS